MSPLLGLRTIRPSGDENSERGMGSDSGVVNASDDICVKVLHLNTNKQFEVTLPCDSTFGALKSFIAQKIGSKLELHKLLFRGKVKEDDDDNLHTAGVKDNSKVSLVDIVTSKETILERVNESSAISTAEAAVSKVREEVDNLSEKVSILKVSVDSGANVDDKDIVYLTEMLTRQLLKLDGIEALGEGKAKRKLEVKRVQALLDTLDNLKSTNMKSSMDIADTESQTTQWETFEPYSETSPSATLPSQPSLPPQSFMPPIYQSPLSSNPYSQLSSNHNAFPHPNPHHVSYASDYTNPYLIHHPDPYYAPSYGLPTTPFSVPYYDPYPIPYSPTFIPQCPYYPYPFYTQKYPHYPYPMPQSAPFPSHPFPPYTSMTHPETSQLPSTPPNTTQTWEHVD